MNTIESMLMVYEYYEENKPEELDLVICLPPSLYIVPAIENIIVYCMGMCDEAVLQLIHDNDGQQNLYYWDNLYSALCCLEKKYAIKCTRLVATDTIEDVIWDKLSVDSKLNDVVGKVDGGLRALNIIWRKLLKEDKDKTISFDATPWKKGENLLKFLDYLKKSEYSVGYNNLIDYYANLIIYNYQNILKI